MKLSHYQGDVEAPTAAKHKDSRFHPHAPQKKQNYFK
jgi:hypothetical protein